MADRSTSLLVEGLTRGLSAPAGLPLVGSPSRPGLFASAARKIALHCKEQGLVDVVAVEKKGRTAREICTVNEKGLAFLLSQSSPRPILEQIVHNLASQQVTIDALTSAAEAVRDRLDRLKTIVERVLHHKTDKGHNGVHHAKDPGQSICEALSDWQGSGDCPLPELYRRLEPTLPHWTIGRFHDQLRHLREEGLIELHPWSGPLYDMPEPPFALMIGHEVAYYACIRLPYVECRMPDAAVRT
ncbi:MAG: hypothetical protein AB7K24_03345 [Gemmataceae bacterium]